MGSKHTFPAVLPNLQVCYFYTQKHNNIIFCTFLFGTEQTIIFFLNLFIQDFLNFHTVNTLLRSSQCTSLICQFVLNSSINESSSVCTAHKTYTGTAPKSIVKSSETQLQQVDCFQSPTESHVRINGKRRGEHIWQTYIHVYYYCVCECGCMCEYA